MKSQKKSILVVDDQKESRELTCLYLEDLYCVTGVATKIDCLTALKTSEFSLVILDLLMPDVDELELFNTIYNTYPDIPILIFTGSNEIKYAITALKSGAYDYILKQDKDTLLLKSIENALKHKQLQHQIESFKNSQLDNVYVPNIDIYQSLYKRALTAAKAGLSILIRGETGTGKDILAKYIQHHICENQAVVTVNCGAICKSLSESELFGHEKGTFTGADERRMGKFELANEGILFLDEIGNMPIEIQQSILRILEDKTVTRLGSDKNIPITFQLLSATNENLKKAIEKGQFREDLYYRISQVIIDLPPLRENPAYIVELTHYFVRIFNEKYKKSFQVNDQLLAELLSRKWPGNIRELKHFLQTKIALGEWPSTKNYTYNDQIALIETEILNSALKENEFNISKTAEHLQLKRTTLIHKLQKLNLTPKDSSL